MNVVTDHNVAARLSRTARLTPTALAIVEPVGPPQRDGTRGYSATTFEELDRRTDCLARGLIHWGIRPGMRIVLAVPFGAHFIEWTFAILKSGAAVVLVDPGMGRKNIVRCLSEAQPDGFVAIPKAQLVRRLLRKRFPRAKWNVTVGARWLAGGQSESRLRQLGSAPVELPTRQESDDAAIIFTTGSTGPPKGVRYTHRIFNNQIDLIRKRYEIRPGSRDLACFPLFGLFDAVMGVTTVIPDMDPTRPANVNPRRILEAVNQWEIDQAFGSPALWNTVCNWCVAHDERLGSLRRVLSAGAPVPAATLEKLRGIVHPDADIFTPYGATEALPIASIESRQVIEETSTASRQGRGTCVGQRFEQIEWRVIAIVDGPLQTMAEVHELPAGEIGELMVTGPVVTQQYVTRTEQNALHKVQEGDRVWHRMGDLGYLDEEDRFWFCGRKAHRVTTADGELYTVPCEAIFNEHAAVYRTALVGVGPRGQQHPVLIVEPLERSRYRTPQAAHELVASLQQLAQSRDLTSSITDIRIYPDRLPVDIRHNSKIFREQLAEWAAGEGRA